MKKTTFYYQFYTVPVLFLAAVGFSASLYLALSHYRNYTDIGYSSFCAISKAINCDTVSQSSWSILFGVPLALWGAFVYAFFFILALPAQINSEERRGLWELLFAFALICSCADIYFGYVSAVEIQAYCIMCLLTYAVSFSLLFSIWIIRRRFNKHSLFEGIRSASIFMMGKDKRTRSALICLIAAFVLLKLFLPSYWIYEYPELSNDVHSGMTEQGHPWIGGENPMLVLHEFTDYQCFQCSKMHFVLRQLVSKHPDALRLVHHHYPMDEKFNTILVKKPFHTGSGMLALLAIAAAKQDKFWQVNDSLYAIIRNGIKAFTINKFAKKAGLDAEKLKKDMYSETAFRQLEADILTGLKNKIIGTPAFIVDGKVYQGQLSDEILKRINELPEK